MRSRPRCCGLHSVSDPTPELTALAEAAERAVPGWVLRCVERRLGGMPVPESAAAVAAEAGRMVADELRALAPGHTPLEVLRAAVVFPTHVLAEAGAAPVERDAFSVEHFPDDVYDLTPANWVDIDESLLEPGVRWMAARVIAHRAAHSADASEAG